VPRFDPAQASSGPLVRGFADGCFVVDGERHRSVLLTPERAIAWDPPAIGALAEEHLEPALALQPLPEFLLLGTGSGLTHPPRALVRTLEAKGVGVEVMDSRAAARTWAVLRAEERWIIAALMPL